MVCTRGIDAIYSPKGLVAIEKRIISKTAVIGIDSLLQINDEIHVGGGYRLTFEISLFRNTFNFNTLQFRNHKRGGGGKSTHFLKALFKTHSEINVSRSWLWHYLKYSAPKITTSQHMQQKECSLEMNVFFDLEAEKAENFSTCFSDL